MKGERKMLFEVLKKLIALKGLTEELREKIDLLYALGRLTTEQYQELVGKN